MVWVGDGEGKILRSTKTIEVGNARYNAALEQAGPMVRELVGVFEPLSAVMAMSGGAMAYVVFNKLFMINHYTLLTLYPVTFPKNVKVVLM